MRKLLGLLCIPGLLAADLTRQQEAVYTKLARKAGRLEDDELSSVEVPNRLANRFARLFAPLTAVGGPSFLEVLGFIDGARGSSRVDLTLEASPQSCAGVVWWVASDPTDRGSCGPTSCLARVTQAFLRLECDCSGDLVEGGVNATRREEYAFKCKDGG